jgi:hypothetical protein
MAWARLWHALKNKVRPWISRGKDRFNRLDQVFECAAASEFKPDDKKPRSQHQQQCRTGESQNGGDKQRNFRPSIFEPTQNTSGNANTSCNSNNSGTGNSKSGKFNKASGGSPANISTAPGLSKEIYERRMQNRQSTRCGSRAHTPYLSTKYSKSSRPEQNSSNNSGYDGKQIKHQNSFNTKQQTK